MKQTDDNNMTAAEALAAARNEGVDVRLDDDGIVVRPCMRLSDATHAAVAKHQSEIARLLRDEAKGSRTEEDWFNSLGMPTPDRVKLAEHDICIVADGDYWAVLDLMHRYREDGQIPLPSLLHSRLESPEAAELARRQAIACLLDNGSTRGPSELNDAHYTVAGRILEFLRRHNGDGPEALSHSLAESRPWECRRAIAADDDMDPNIPF